MSWKLGLTGSIGMGKSTTAAMFRELGVPVWDADETVHRLYAKGGTAVAAIAALYPAAIEDDAVSRAKLRHIIASDPAALPRIEAAVHPLLAADREDFIHSNKGLSVFDMPLLFETGADKWLDSVLVVTVPAEVQRARVLARKTMGEEDLDRILARQMPDAEKRARADHVIETLTLAATRAAVKDLVAELTRRAEHA